MLKLTIFIILIAFGIYLKKPGRISDKDGKIKSAPAC
jgi:hypothetical protein